MSYLEVKMVKQVWVVKSGWVTLLQPWKHPLSLRPLVHAAAYWRKGESSANRGYEVCLCNLKLNTGTASDSDLLRTSCMLWYCSLFPPVGWTSTNSRFAVMGKVTKSTHRHQIPSDSKFPFFAVNCSFLTFPHFYFSLYLVYLIRKYKQYF